MHQYPGHEHVNPSYHVLFSASRHHTRNRQPRPGAFDVIAEAEDTPQSFFLFGPQDLLSFRLLSSTRLCRLVSVCGTGCARCLCARRKIPAIPHAVSHIQIQRSTFQQNAIFVVSESYSHNPSACWRSGYQLIISFGFEAGVTNRVRRHRERSPCCAREGERQDRMRNIDIVTSRQLSRRYHSATKIGSQFNSLSFNMASITQWIKSQLFLSIPRPRESLESKVIIITGANTGLGLEAARHCVHLNAFKVILAVRSESRGQEAKRDIEATTKRYGVVEVCLLDLASYDSIKAFVAEMARLPRIDAIIENAGIAGLDYRVIEDNEGMITVNVVSTMLLATLMLPVLSASAKKHDTTGMISIVSSETHAWAKFREQRCDEIFRTLNDKGKANMAERYVVPGPFLQCLPRF